MTRASPFTIEFPTPLSLQREGEHWWLEREGHRVRFFAPVAGPGQDLSEAPRGLGIDAPEEPPGDRARKRLEPSKS